MSDACSSSVEMSPEAALQGLVGALRARHDPPPGQRAVTTNGWKAVDELELIMRRWRATLDLGNKSEVTMGKRKADACKKHFSRLRSDLWGEARALGGTHAGGRWGPPARRRRRFFWHFFLFGAIFYLFSWEFGVLAAMLSRLATSFRRC